MDWALRTIFEIEVEHGRIIDLTWGSPLQLRASIRKRWPDVQAEAALDHKLEKVAETIGDYEPVEEFRNHLDGTRNGTAKDSAPKAKPSTRGKRVGCSSAWLGTATTT